MKLNRFDPAPCAFPKPRVALLPDRPELLAIGKSCSASSARHAPSHFRHFTRGRYALGAAYQLAGVGRNGALLAPAYHCVTMLDPAVALAADVQLYPLHADLSPDLEKLDQLLTTCKKPVKALLATHFFGLAQDFTGLKEWCDKHDIVLIEDCSHVLFTEGFQAAGTGLFGRFVAASPYKFFPCADGGLLYSSTEQLLAGVKTESAGLLQELRGIKRTWEQRRSAGAMADETGAIDKRLESFSRHPLIAANEGITPYSQPSALFSANAAKTASLRGSRFIVSRSSIEENIRRRRNNYRLWLAAVAGLPNCHPLFPDLPDACAPYMFPLHIEHPTPYFYWLKHLGVPIWRWDEMAVSDCPVAQDYRLHLLHLPCHQSLSDKQMNWLTTALQKTLHHPAQGA